MLVRNILEAKGAVLYTVHPDALLSECVITMADEDVGSLVVMDGAKLVGIVTFREVIRVLARRQKELRQGPTPAVAELKVRDVMATDPICATLDTELHDLRALMIKHHQRYLPVMDKDVLAGVVSFHDVAKSVYEQQLFENKMLKAYIRDWPEESAAP